MRWPASVPLGLLLSGYGVLVLLGVISHESYLAGGAALALGLILLLLPLALARWRTRRANAPPRPPAAASGSNASTPRPGPPTSVTDGSGSGPSLPRAAAISPARARLVATLGIAMAVAVVGYNVARDSDLLVAEWGILAYGLLLAAAAPWLGRRLGPTTVGALVGWSFPLLLAPLALFALNAAISSGTGATAAAPVVQALVVQPSALGLRATGMDVNVIGSTMVVPTPRGTLSLGVGLVCAGLYPIVLFSGLVAMHAWTERLGARQAAILVGAGITGLWVMNLVRLVALTRIGVAWGPGALQAAHANLGWILFALYMALFWWIAIGRRGKAVATPA